MGVDRKERIAKQILQDRFPNKFSGLIKGESPDWHNDDLGLEIVESILELDAQFESIYKKYANKPKEKIPKKILKSLGFDENLIRHNVNPRLYFQNSDRIGKLTYYVDDYNDEKNVLILVGQIGKPRVGNRTDGTILDIITTKILKLNKHYKKYSENDLAILIDDYINCGTQHKSLIIGEIIEQIRDEYSKNKQEYKFDFIYLIYRDCLVEIETQKGENGYLVNRSRVVDFSQDDFEI